jgi:hypothetical protein
MTNDQIWHQSTVMERCEILRSRLDSLSTIPPMPPEPTPEQVERWRRIEAAARAVTKARDEGFSPSFKIGLLSEALRS